MKRLIRQLFRLVDAAPERVIAFLAVSGVRLAPLPRWRGEWDVGVDLVVPHDRALRAAVLFEFDEAVVGELVHVLEDLWRVPVDETCQLADALRLVFDDRFQELEVGRAEDATERFEVLDRERRLARFDVLASVDRFEALFEATTVGGLDLDVECSGHDKYKQLVAACGGVWDGSPYLDRLPVVALLRWERCSPGAEDFREAGVVDLEGLAPEMELVDAVVVVEPDDRVVCAGFTVVVGVLDPVLESLRRRDREHAYPRHGAVGVGFNLVFEYGDIIAHPHVY